MIPNEILAKIFTAGTDIWRDHHPYELPFPILVSGTTSHWRQLARNTPNLWAFIMVPMHKDPDFCLLWTSEWLSRSGALPISVILDHRIRSRLAGRIQETSHGISQTILRIVKSSAQRLRRLDIFISSSEPQEILAALHELDAPHLQQVSLCNGDRFPSAFSGGETPWPWLVNLPKLTKLRLRSMLLPFVPHLTSLTAYSLRLTYEDVQAIFSASPDLAHLVLQNLIPIAGPVPLNRDLIQVDSLRSLAISMSGLKNEVYLFQLLTIPNLTYLEVDDNLQVFTVLGSSILSSKIETLRISGISTFSRQNIPDLKNYPPLASLQHLQLICAPTAALLLFRNEPEMGLSRRRSIGLRTMSPHNNNSIFSTTAETTNHRPTPLAEPPEMPWPKLRTIIFDTLLASDVAELCRFVQLHKGVQRVELSPTAMRHLSGSLRRDGDSIYHLLPQLRIPIIKGVEGTKDVPEWLGTLVELRVFDPRAYGLLDHGFPFREMS
ncbi:hypothetical protein M413DRAFT_447062 [Hebeloma cylindrosporum]|uniref:F-box domain-containing protein n=1 Tax=Hebeloma cylindrosporum TaxID=76867 RepID=A0A0C3C5Q1_HEBCY|nr:hypothetical protein M413DRAFT_447062 [Hebeloma cylindrosporum h7]